MKNFKDLITEMSKKEIEDMMARYGVDSSKQDFSKIAQKKVKDAHSTQISSAFRNKSDYSSSSKSKTLYAGDLHSLELRDFLKEEKKKLLKKFKLPKESKPYEDRESVVLDIEKTEHHQHSADSGIETELKNIKKYKEEIEELRSGLRNDTEYPVKAFQQKLKKRTEIRIANIGYLEDYIITTKERIVEYQTEIKDSKKELSMLKKVMKVFDKIDKELDKAKKDFANYWNN